MNNPFNFESNGTVKINSEGLVLNDEHIEAFIDDCIRKLERMQTESEKETEDEGGEILDLTDLI